MMQLKRLFVFLAFVLCTAHSVAARPQGAAVSTPDIPTYPDSEPGLKHLMQDALNAAKSNDRTKLEEITNSMVLPSSDDLFSSTFGPVRGKFYAKLYSENNRRIAADLSGIFWELTSGKFGILAVHEFKNQCDFSADQDEYPVLAERIVPEPFSVVRFSHGSLVKEFRFLAYVNGGFRFLGQLSASAGFVSNTGKAMVHDSASDSSSDTNSGRSVVIPQPKWVHQVHPEYPMEARNAHIQGTVVVHVIINKDGTIGELHLIRGQCPLARAAIEAIKQWRFEPTLLDGKAIQVETEFEVGFHMGWR